MLHKGNESLKASSFTDCAVQALDVQRDRFGFFIGGVDKKLWLFSPLSLWCTGCRISWLSQNVINLFSQGCDVNGQTVSTWRQKKKKVVVDFWINLCLQI